MTISLKSARVNSKLTQEEAAKKIGVSKNTLLNRERGKSFPDVIKIRMIEKVYNISYNDIDFLPKNYT